MSSQITSTLVLGIGNLLLRDEGAGVHVIRHLQEHHPCLPGAIYLDGGTLSFALTAYLQETTQLIVVDAAELQAPPGTVRTFLETDMDRFIGTPKKSVHEVSLADLLDIARLTYGLPLRRALVGIQPALFGWGTRPSRAVREAIPLAAAVVRDLLARWEPGSGTASYE